MSETPKDIAETKLARTSFAEKVEEYAKIHVEHKALESRKKELAAQIQKLMIDYKTLHPVNIGRLRVSYSPGTERMELNPQILLEEGVPAEVLEKAREPIRSKAFITVKTINGQTED